MVLRLLSCSMFFAMGSFVIADDILIEGLIVVPIDRIDVPARATGMIKSLQIGEGDSVSKGQAMASLDDDQAVLEAERAATHLRISEQTASASVDLDLARKTAERTEQAAKTQMIAREIAKRQATNDIRVRAAEKAEAVASNELNRATEARKSFVDSVSRSEIDGLTLAFERSQLETKQAAFERETDTLLAQSEEATFLEQRLAVQQSRLGINKAIADQSIAVLKSQAAARDADLALLAVTQHKLVAPIDGVVVKILRRPGQWVQTGEPVIEILRLDRLRAQGFVDQSLAAKLRSLPKVTLQSNDNGSISLAGEVVFVTPEVDPVNGEVCFWIEFDNPNHDVLPGMKISLTVVP